MQTNWQVIGLVLSMLCLLGCQRSSQKDIPAYFSEEKKREVKEARQRKALRIKREARYLIPCQGGLRATQPASVRTFDREGRLLDETIFAAVGKLQQRRECVYDSVGNKLKVNYYNRYDELSEVEQFDEQGHLTLSLRLTGSGKARKKYREITYNSENHIQEAREYDHNEQLLSEVRYSYHPSGAKQKKLHIYYDTHSPHLREKRRIRKDYDEKGQLVLDYIATLRDTMQRSLIHQYNSDGTLEESSYYDVEQRLLGRKRYTYSKENHLLQSELIWLDSRGKEKERYLQRFLSEDRPKEIIYYDSTNTELSRQLYEYDEKGRLIHTEEYRADKPKGRTCFIYEYTFY